MPQTQQTDQEAVHELVDALIGSYESARSLAVTWLNHYSAPIALAGSGGELGAFDVIGVDGKLLQILLGGQRRTSADLVVPVLLPRLIDARVALIGGTPDELATRIRAVRQLLGPGSDVVYAADGFAGLPAPGGLGAIFREQAVNVVLLGLGAGLQERFAVESKRAFVEGGIALTCGGFLDQLLYPSYYPSWAYPLRLNWLVRLAREPRRLWRRYTIDALRAAQRRPALRAALLQQPGLWV